MSVAAPSDKRFRRAHLKPGRKRSPWVWRGQLVVMLVTAAIVAYTGRQAIDKVAQLEIFFIDHIVVAGNVRLSKGEVLALLQDLPGRSILTIDLEEWRGALLSSPWVSDAVLRRRLPSTVEVAIQERAPLGIGRIRSVLYLVDERGAIIDEYGPSYADLDLPIIDGLSSARGEENADAYRALLARRLLDSLRARNLAGQVSQIDVSDSRNAVVLLEGDPTLIRLGNERFVERLQSYFELAPTLRERVPAIDYVDLRFEERVYVRPAKGSPVRSDNAKTPVRPARGTQTG